MIDKQFSDPKKNILQFKLREGMRVADFGSGSGHYSRAAAQIVGDRGRVYAIDIQKELLREVKNFSSREQQDIIDVLCGDIETVGGSKLPDESVDAVMLTNILFQIEDKETTISEARRVLKSGSNVFFIDWSESFGNIGPHSDAVVDKATAKNLFEQSGFALEREFKAGVHHYGLVFKKT